MNKSIPYVLSVLGLILVLLGFDGIRTILNISVLESLNGIYLSLAGVVLVVLAIILLRKNPSKKMKEVPIYEGKKIVGYRMIQQ